ncbi:MAG: MazG nucleotide pyrophosphohydrolase domain-containing protein [Desulfurococcales archaeon]|nr:MazG nucleotide pyrophosphohydrolase domain-containing protein [Desulfurococcales archaeon]
MDLREAQDLIAKLYINRDRGRGIFATFTWFIEEVGELAEALLSGDKKSIEEEIADVFAWLLSIANLINVDVAEAFKRKYLEDSNR